MQHTISVLVQNEAGALSRIVNVFSARGLNLENLTASPAADAKHAIVTIVVADCDEATIEKILKQLNRLIPVLSVDRGNREEQTQRRIDVK